ncbi:penicillin-insensitive murein endopeptidase [Pseudenhygromyxa sp. WMMC2535]|uniref:penicillin-insensitive murein endopeptidase n=1 Tax=Pseudenhygromyxa sp. WMMC2535 TaxID=2712867 RepID=UPI001553735A|nr:penicillin-insensitive murein endopeptidase [Pseudenhygromyxa sp. WMMC2535]NVB37607.1 penicillin-insensitive murein endopeptidase [Pseudenhygromyxa sp. WMMC2535]
MAPSNDDNGRGADLDDDTALDHEDGRFVDEVDGDEGIILDDEVEDGLAPEAGRRSPSLLSLLLLVAGAIWIVVAMLKLGDSAGIEGIPPAAIDEIAQDSGVALPDVDEPVGSDADEQTSASPGEIEDEAQPPAPASADEGEALVDDPERSSEPEVGTPGSERGPPEGSLLAGKVWPQDYVAPEVVHYTIKRGGSMKVVANLYKIFHHEIEALNPGVSLDRDLPPATKIVVYKHTPGGSSESVNFPGDGGLEGAMPMVDGPGRVIKHIPWKGWATRTTVATLDAVLREWARRFPSRQPILVGNMSAREGGRLKPHSSHQSGRDVDLSYPQIWDRKEELNWRTMDSKNLDRELTWSLLELLRETGAVEVIFIDSKLQKLLYDHAVATKRHSKAALREWMEYPNPPGSGSPLIRHVRGHADHIHVRFKCTAAEDRCKSRDR